MTTRHSVKIQLGGTEFTVSSEHPPEYTREVAAYFDAVLARIRGSLPSVDAHKAALLARYTAEGHKGQPFGALCDRDPFNPDPRALLMK